MKIEIGQQFDTEFEVGCTVTSLPNERGHFLGIDSDGIECIYAIGMVKKVLPECTCRVDTDGLDPHCQRHFGSK